MLAVRRARGTAVTGSLRILVDGRVMQDRYHGIGRYTYELLRELSLDTVDLTVLYHPERGRLGVGELMTCRNVRAAPSRVPVASLLSQYLLALGRAGCPAGRGVVPYHLSTPILACGVPVVSVVHDCVFERDAAAHGRSAFSLAYRAATRLAIRSAVALAAPSTATRDDIRRFYGIELPPECVLPHGVGTQFLPCRAGPGPGLPAFPAATSCTWERGVRTRTRASWWRPWPCCKPATPAWGSSSSAQPDPRFPDEVGRLVTALGLSDLVRLPTDVDDTTLLDLYANAAAFAYPSLVEGFGMPVLEAMAAGLAVVASDAEAVREVARGGALIVPAREPGAWAHALGHVLADLARPGT